MIEVIVTILLLAIGLGVIIRVSSEPRQDAIIPAPMIKPLNDPTPLEKEVKDKADATVRNISELMNELERDEARKKDISESDTMRAIDTKVNRLKDTV